MSRKFSLTVLAVQLGALHVSLSFLSGDAQRAFFSSRLAANVQLISIGGLTGDLNELTSETNILTISNNSHTRAASMPKKLAYMGSTIVNNTIYTVGGYSNPDYNRDFLSYDIAANKWTSLTGFPQPIAASTIFSYNDSIYLLGGQFSGGFNSFVYKYEFEAQTWTELGVTPVVVRNCAFAYKNRLYATDESGGMYRSDDGAQNWQLLNSNNQGPSLRNPACALVSDKGMLVLAGGTDLDGKIYNTVMVYNINTYIWRSLPPMLKPRTAAPAVVFPDGSNDVVVCGGSTNGKQPLADCEIFSWQAQQWSVANFSLPSSLQEFALFINPMPST